ncbi:hypothetical protein BJX61DRAFT_499963 [Aspergillus egyptiacus]|nr:hypothetical protein BJX61DRAFT_499963 [Aspergillus egyptiacus]
MNQKPASLPQYWTLTQRHSTTCLPSKVSSHSFQGEPRDGTAVDQGVRSVRRGIKTNPARQNNHIPDQSKSCWICF